MTPPRQRPFPFGPVQRELERRFDVMHCTDDSGAHYEVAAGDAHRSAELLGVNRKLIGRWRNGQGLTEVDADHCAIALGLHPIDLWPDWHDICAAIEADKEQRRRAAIQRGIDKNRARRQAAAA